MYSNRSTLVRCLRRNVEAHLQLSDGGSHVGQRAAQGTRSVLRSRNGGDLNTQQRINEHQAAKERAREDSNERLLERIELYDNLYEIYYRTNMVSDNRHRIAVELGELKKERMRRWREGSMEREVA